MGLLGVATWSSDPVEVNVNGGADGRGVSAGDEHAGFHGSTTAMVEVFDCVSVGAEGVTEVRRDGTVDRVSGLGGVIWSVSGRSALRLGTGGVWSPEGPPEWFGTLGYSITVPDGRRLPRGRLRRRAPDALRARGAADAAAVVAGATLDVGSRWAG